MQQELDEDSYGKDPLKRIDFDLGSKDIHRIPSLGRPQLDTITI